MVKIKTIKQHEIIAQPDLVSFLYNVPLPFVNFSFKGMVI